MARISLTQAPASVCPRCNRPITGAQPFRSNGSFSGAGVPRYSPGTMRAPTTPELELLASATRERLGAALERHGRLVYSNSLGAEAIVLTDLIWSHFPTIEMFSIDTGRLPEETY